MNPKLPSLRSFRPRPRRGQSLVEFALALPILLLLLMGIIEFGRLLHAFLAVQNAARFAIRYAVTREYNTDYCNPTIHPDFIKNGLVEQGVSASNADAWILDDVQSDGIYNCRVERLYLSGPNAGDAVTDYIDKTAALQDVARLPSIRDTARAGAAGIAMNSNLPWTTPRTTLSEAMAIDNRDEWGWFYVTVCSGRDADNNNEEDYEVHSPPAEDEACTRVSNGSWIEDAGDQGDTVVVMVRFNHPLITPIISNLWPLLPLRAQREGIVEQFRIADVQGVANPVGGFPTATPTLTRTPTETPTVTQTPTITNTPTVTQTSTPTFTTSPTNTATSTNTRTVTNTSTQTRTPTNTATPNCTLFTSTAFSQTTSGSGQPRVQLTITNGSGVGTFLQSLTFTWTAYDTSNPAQTLDRWRFDGTDLVTADDLDSPTTWSNPGGLGTGDDLDAGEADVLSFTFLNVDGAWPGIVPANSFGLTLSFSNGCSINIGAQPTPTPTLTGTATRTSTITNTATITQTFTRTASPTITQTFTRTASPTITRTPTITNTPTITPTFTRTATITQTPTITQTFTRTASPTITRTFTPTITRTFTATGTITNTPTITRTFTPTQTPLPPTNTNTATATRTRTNTPAATNTFTPAPPTATFTNTPSRTPMPPTATFTSGPTFTPTRTKTPIGGGGG